MTMKPWALALAAALLPLVGTLGRGQDVPKDLYEGFDWQVPNLKLLTPFKDELPIYFVNRTQNLKEWNTLKAFWNEDTEKTSDPLTGEPVERKVLKVKVPLGLSQ